MPQPKPIIIPIAQEDLALLQSRAVHLYSYETSTVAEAWIRALEELMQPQGVVFQIEPPRKGYETLD